jgi:hypothetical protein
LRPLRALRLGAHALRARDVTRDDTLAALRDGGCACGGDRAG